MKLTKVCKNEAELALDIQRIVSFTSHISTIFFSSETSKPS